MKDSSSQEILSFFAELESQINDAKYSREIHLHSDWTERLEFSRGLELGHAAPGGRYSQALCEAVQNGKVRGVFEVLKGQVVVELGAGCTTWGAFLASLSDARGYIGIEAFYSDVLRHNLKEATFPYLVIGDDMLSSLSRLPEQSVSVLACGIEDCILPNPRYKKLVEDEVRRILHPEGALICSQSDLKLPERKKSLFRFQREKSKVKDEGCIYYATVES